MVALNLDIFFFGEGEGRGGGFAKKQAKELFGL